MRNSAIGYVFLSLTEQADDESSEDGEEGSTAPRDPPADPNDEFNFANYDEEDTNSMIFDISLCSFYTINNITCSIMMF